MTTAKVYAPTYGRGDGTCHYCGVSLVTRPRDDTTGQRPHNEWTRDHVVPRSQGGSNRQDNLVDACLRCNLRKGVRSVPEFAAVLYSEWRHPEPECQSEALRYVLVRYVYQRVVAGLNPADACFADALVSALI